MAAVSYESNTNGYFARAAFSHVTKRHENLPTGSKRIMGNGHNDMMIMYACVSVYIKKSQLKNITFSLHKEV
jgi:hypothetical protein